MRFLGLMPLQCCLHSVVLNHKHWLAQVIWQPGLLSLLEPPWSAVLSLHRAPSSLKSLGFAPSGLRSRCTGYSGDQSDSWRETILKYIFRPQRWASRWSWTAQCWLTSIPGSRGTWWWRFPTVGLSLSGSSIGVWAWDSSCRPRKAQHWVPVLSLLLRLWPLIGFPSKWVLWYWSPRLVPVGYNNNRLIKYLSM